MSAIDDALAANDAYAAAFRSTALDATPRRRLAVVTCMDARLDPKAFLGLEDGDAHVLRNAGGVVTDDTLRSLAISHWLLGTQEALVVAHTDCGMQKFANDELRRKLAAEGHDAAEVDFLPFSDLETSVRDSVRRIASSPLLPRSYRAAGCVFEVHTGRLRRVA